MKCKFPGCERVVTRKRVGKPAAYCSPECESAGRNYNFNGEPTGVHSIYRRLSEKDRARFKRWLESG
jgi:hypothetical protein